MDYESLRIFADSWGLLFLVLVFVGIVAFVFRPGANRHHKDAAQIPLRED